MIRKGRGHEQHGYRPSVVVSTEKFNEKGIVWLVPATSKKHGGGFQVNLDSLATDSKDSYAITNQIKAFDMKARPYKTDGSLIEEEELLEVLGKIISILGFGS